MSKSSSTFLFKRTTAAESRHSTMEGSWVPNTDVYVTDGGLVIKVELAGMRREDLELTADGNRLTIAGQRPDVCRASKCTFLVMEINYGAFESIIELPPDYNLGQAKAAYHNGFLRIDVPEHTEETQKSPPDSEEE